jgi:hypothetical protein
MYNVYYADAGSRASFYIIDEHRGFKEFESKRDAEYAQEVQFILSNNNAAPKVLSDVGRIVLPEHLRCDEKKFSGWGFITELAEMVGCGGNDCGCGECDDIYESIYPKVKRLHNKIERLGYHFADDHVGNIGYIKRRGRKVLVCIDTGRESIYDNNDDVDYSSDYNNCSCYQCQQYREGRNV